MKRFVTAFAALICVAAGVFHWTDLVQHTDLTTGFISQGPYWVRYLILGILLLLIALVTWFVPKRTKEPASGTTLEGLVDLAAGAGFAVLGGARCYGFSALNRIDQVQTVLYLVSAVWFLLLGRSRLSSHREAPTRSAVVGVVGTLSLYLLTVQRFCLAPTGAVRVENTLASLAALASLVFAVAQMKESYLFTRQSARWLHFTGLSAFLLATCLTLPSAICGFRVGGLDKSELIEAAALGILGLCGLVSALAAAGREPAAKAVQPMEEAPESTEAQE